MVTLFRRSKAYHAAHCDGHSEELTASTQGKRLRRGGVMFQDTPETPLQRVKYGPAVGKSILKVATLEESLKSCCPSDDGKRQSTMLIKQASLRVSELATALRQSLVRVPSRLACSLPPGVGGGGGTGMEKGNESVTSTVVDGSSLVEASETQLLQQQRPQVVNNETIVETKAVRFSALHIRLYDVMVDDNPAVSSGPAIALSWTYRESPSGPVWIDDYEATRAPRPAFKDLKLTLAERLRILRASGVARSEILSYTRRVNAAKRKRRQAMEDLSIHGKQYLETLEKRENMRRTVERWFGVRKTQSTEERHLWDKAQQQQQQKSRQ